MEGPVRVTDSTVYVGRSLTSEEAKSTEPRYVATRLGGPVTADPDLVPHGAGPGTRRNETVYRIGITPGEALGELIITVQVASPQADPAAQEETRRLTLNEFAIDNGDWLREALKQLGVPYDVSIEVSRCPDAPDPIRIPEVRAALEGRVVQQETQPDRIVGPAANHEVGAG
jgi:hypothetical protein